MKLEGMIWNTVYHITYQGEEIYKDSVYSVFESVGKSLSVFDSNSLVSKLNQGDSVEADDHLMKVYEKSRQIHEVSNGSFDPTVSPLVKAWGFGEGHKPTNDTTALDSILKFVGIDKTYSKGDYIYKKDPRINFNFSAIAKGYGADAIGEMFQRNGISNYMVEIGGEIALKGKSPSGDKWRIAIDAPLQGSLPQDQIAMVIELTDCSIATSGNYRNYREENGTKTAHTISPQSGRPFFSKILSATVVAATCMEADALATACMASEPEEAKRIIRESHTDGLLIFGDSNWMSPGFKTLIISEVSEPGRRVRN